LNILKKQQKKKNTKKKKKLKIKIWGGGGGTSWKENKGSKLVILFSLLNKF